MATRKGRQVVVETSTRSNDGGEQSENPLYGVAMLKIALELKRPGAGPFEAVVARVMARMRLDEGDFRGFLERQGGLLRALVRGPSPA